MKRKVIDQKDIKSLKLKKKKIDFKKITELIKKIGDPLDKPTTSYGNYNPS